MNKSAKFLGKSIYFRDEGEGQALVLLHGFLESSLMWDEFIPELAKDFRVIAIDLPGFGKTSVLAETHTMEIMAGAVKSVLDALSIRNCIMIGHSMGGYATLEFADEYPGYLKGMVLFHSHASADTEEAKENRNRTIHIVKLNRKGFINQFIPDLFAEQSIERFAEKIDLLKSHASNIPNKAIIAALQGMKERSSKLDLLLKTQLPVLFIAGKEDLRLPIQNVMAQAVLPQHTEVLILGNVGHMGFIEARPETIEMVRSFSKRTYKLT